ncbi:GNAT family N-acetyltransferase [Peptoniphilus catoniae]|uniref:GNAT family N-acetyltransferase n=1 Tax=Peptoniphilus catoniae TaxID=1660341 RepID=UPI0010FEC098|nr:GNAT family N-acetyltransferase [Peptoniphilus catoniae]
MEIKHGTNKFYIGRIEEAPQAQMVYEDKGDYVNIEHTIVSDNLTGQGVAGRLLDALVNWAREDKKKVRATCSYAYAKLQDEKYQDVFEKNI